MYCHRDFTLKVRYSGGDGILNGDFNDSYYGYLSRENIALVGAGWLC
jgi:hypothetical protein